MRGGFGDDGACPSLITLLVPSTFISFVNADAAKALRTRVTIIGIIGACGG
jgi:hypothetical protein